MNYDKNGYKVCCDQCGQHYARNECRFQWNNLLACPNCFEPRHPITQPLPAVQDDISARDARPRKITYITGLKGLSTWGVAYIGNQGLRTDLTWGSWSVTWNDDQDPDDFILD